MQGLHVPMHWARTRVKYLVRSMRAGDTITVDSIEKTSEYPVYGANGLSLDPPMKSVDQGVLK
jgi:type I restriction enzyme, S subunit